MRSVPRVIAAPSDLSSKALATQGTKPSSLTGFRRTRRTALLTVTALLASTFGLLGVSATPASAAPLGTLSIVAGVGYWGVPVAGPATSSPLTGGRMATDSLGNLYIADMTNKVIERVTPGGTLSIVAGTGSGGAPTPGPATSSALQSPSGVAVDSLGNLFISDDVRCVISKVDTTGQLSIVAGNGTCDDPTPGPATSSALHYPNDVAVDSLGNLFIGGYEQFVEKVTPDGTLSIFAGNGSFGDPTPGPATSSAMSYPVGMAVDSAGNLFIASGSNVILKVTPDGTLSIVAGNGSFGAPTPGPATSSALQGPNDVAVDSAGNLFIADTGSNMIEKVTPEGTLSIVAGTGTDGAPTLGPATNSKLNLPYGVAVDSSGNLFISDAMNGLVEKVTFTAPLPHVITNTIQLQGNTAGLAVSPDGTRLYATVAVGDSVLEIIDLTTNRVLRSITVGATAPGAVVVSPNGSRVYVTNPYDNTVSVINTATNRVIRSISVGTSPRNLAINASGTRLYVLNSGDSSISVIDTATNRVTTTITGFNGLDSLTVSPDGTSLYATGGFFNGTLYIVATATGAITGNISVGFFSKGLAVTPDGGRVYVTHENRNKLTVVSTVAKSVTTNITVGWNATHVAVSADGTRVYVPNASDGNMSVIDTSDDTVIETLATGTDATNLALSPDGKRIYVGNPTSSSAIVFSEQPAGPTLNCQSSAPGKSRIQACWNSVTPTNGTVVRYRATIFVAGTRTELATCKGAPSETSCEVAGRGFLFAATNYDIRVRFRIKTAPGEVFWSLYSDAARVTTQP